MSEKTIEAAIADIRRLETYCASCWCTEAQPSADDLRPLLSALYLEGRRSALRETRALIEQRVMDATREWPQWKEPLIMGLGRALVAIDDLLERLENTGRSL